MYAEGGIKSQSCPRGSMGKKLDLKGSNFKPMRGLDISTVTSLLEQLTKEKLSMHTRDGKRVQEGEVSQRSTKGFH